MFRNFIIKGIFCSFWKITFKKSFGISWEFYENFIALEGIFLLLCIHFKMQDVFCFTYRTTTKATHCCKQTVGGMGGNVFKQEWGMAKLRCGRRRQRWAGPLGVGAKPCSVTYRRRCALLSFLEEGERGRKHVLLATSVHKHESWSNSGTARGAAGC